MYQRIHLENIEDYFRSYTERTIRGVYFARLTVYNEEIEKQIQKYLEHILSKIDGAGSVNCWVTLSGSSEVVLYEEKDSEQSNLEEADSVGGSRIENNNKSDKTVLTDKDGNPYVVKTLQPEVEGVLVVAEGAGDSIVKKNISEAVQVLFGLDAHRIKVAKKKVEE